MQQKWMLRGVTELIWLSLMVFSVRLAVAQDTQPELLFTVGTDQATEVVWHPSSTDVIVKGVTKGIWIYSIPEWQQVATFPDANGASWSPDGQYLWVRTDTTYALYRFEDVIRNMNAVPLLASLQTLNFSPDTRFVLVKRDDVLQIMDVVSLTVISVLPNEWQALKVKWASNSQGLIGFSDLEWRTWDRASANEQVFVRPAGRPFYALSPDDTLVAFYADSGAFEIHDSQTGVLITVVPVQASRGTVDEFGQPIQDSATCQHSLLWSPNSQEIVRLTLYFCDNFENPVEVFAMDGAPIATQHSGFGYGPETPVLESADFTLDGRYLFIQYSDYLSGIILGVSIFDTETYQAIKTLNFSQIFWSPDSRSIAWTNYNFTNEYQSENTVSIYNIATGTMRLLSGHYANMYISGIWSPDSRYLISLSQDGLIILWKAETWIILKRDETHINTTVNVAFSDDQSRLAVTDALGNIRVWDAHSGQLVSLFHAHDGRITGLKWQPHGNLLATTKETPRDNWTYFCDDNRVRVWNAETGALIKEFAVKGCNNSLEWRDDGQQLAFSDNETGIQIWNPDTDRIEVPSHGAPTPLFATAIFNQNQDYLEENFYSGFYFYSLTGEELPPDYQHHVYFWSPDNQRYRSVTVVCNDTDETNCVANVNTLYDSQHLLPMHALNEESLPIDLVFGKFDSLYDFPTQIGRNYFETSLDKLIQIWRIDDKMAEIVFEYELSALFNPLSIQANPSVTLISVQEFGSRLIVDLVTKQVIAKPEYILGWIDDDWILEQSLDYKRIYQTNVRTGERLYLGDGSYHYIVAGESVAQYKQGMLNVYRLP